jgi:hypothetical protein
VRRFAEANPDLTARVTGFRNGDDMSVVSGLTLDTLAHRYSPFGLYPIVAGGGSARNYRFVYESGWLRVAGFLPGHREEIALPSYVEPTSAPASEPQAENHDDEAEEQAGRTGRGEAADAQLKAEAADAEPLARTSVRAVYASPPAYQGR